MYSLHDYTWMITDEARMSAYVRALQAAIRPGAVVVDVGTGTGILALLACRLGAKCVYAIDTNDAVEVARELARENGVADRIVFFQKDVREVELSERADVIVSDLRGRLPLSGDHLAIIADIRGRFLKPGGVLIPASDRLMVAIVEAPDLYEWALGPACGPLGISLESMRNRLRHSPCSDRGGSPLRPDNVLTPAAAWAVLNYSTVQPAPVAGRASLRVERAGTGHGLALWFEAVLGGGQSFSSAPGHELCYGRSFLPWPRPVALSERDAVMVDVWAQPGGEPWGWNTSVRSGEGTRATFKQSSFLSFASKPVVRSERGLELSQGTKS
jgi:protein arginine N-methyltransferase 1